MKMLTIPEILANIGFNEDVVVFLEPKTRHLSCFVIYLEATDLSLELQFLRS